MDSSTIYWALETIAGDPSTNCKVALLEEFLDDEDFRSVIRYAYDPRYTFGLREVDCDATGDADFNSETWTLLDLLGDRELTGHEAKNAVAEELARLNPESGTLFRRILKGNLEAGINAKLINKARPKTVFTIPYMRCSLPEPKYLNRFAWIGGVFCQLKADGMYVHTAIDNGYASFFTRAGIRIDSKEFNYIHAKMVDVGRHNYCYSGEMIVYRDDQPLDRKVSNGIMNHIVQGGHLDAGDVIHYVVWDSFINPQIAEEKRPYHQRFNQLMEDLDFGRDYIVRMIETHIVYSYEEAQEHYKRWRAMGLEGAVVKDSNGLWKNTTSQWQLKVKPTKECELRVIMMLEGTGKNADTFGSLLCVSEDGYLSAQVAGFTDAMRKEIYQNFRQWQDSIITVKFTEMIQDKKGEWSLSNPRFKEHRGNEKTEADTLEYIQTL